MKDRRDNTLLKRAAAFVLAFALTMTSSGISFAAEAIATPSNAEKATELSEANPSNENTAEAAPSDAENGSDNQGLPGGFDSPIMPVPEGQHADTEIIKETEAAEPEVATPGNAARLELTGDVNGVTVRVIDESGALQEGTEMTVRSMSVPHTDEFKAELQDKGLMAPDMEEEEAELEEDSDEEEYAEPEWPEMVAYDITLTDAEGNELHTLDAPVTVVYEGVDLGEDQNEAAIYHLTDDGFEYVAVAAVEDGTLSFEASEFSGYAAVGHASAGIMTLEMMKSVSISVDEYLTLNGEVGDPYSDHTWSSSNSTIVSVSGETNEGTVHGEKAGTAVITHRYISQGHITKEMFEVIVGLTDDASKGIIFEYHREFSDTVPASKRNIVKYTVDIIDENGNSLVLGNNSMKNIDEIAPGNIIPEKIYYDDNIVDATKSLVSQIVIPNCSYDACYFYWEGAYKETKKTVTEFKNMERWSPNYDNKDGIYHWENGQRVREGFYDSYIGFDTEDDHGNDYPDLGLGEYFAYNPTGTLVVVFVRGIGYKTIYEDLFEHTNNNPSFSEEYTDRAENQNENGNAVWAYYPVDYTNEYDSEFMERVSPHEDYKFVGWSTKYSETDGNGIAKSGEESYLVTADSQVFKDPINRDITFYAVWEKIEPAYTVDKTVEITKADGNTAADKAEVGDTLIYTVTVTNTGNTDLTGLKLEDEFSIDGVVKNNALTWTAGNPADEFDLKQGETKTFTSTYTVQATDNELSNTATVGGQTDTEETTVESKATWTVDKTVEITKADGNTAADKAEAGDTLIYTVTVTNTGNTDLTGLKLEDEFSIDGVVKNNALTWTEGNPADEFNIAEGETKTFTSTYTVQATDNELSNTATVDGQTDTEETTVESKATWTVDKTVEITKADGNTAADKAEVGDTLIYTVTVTNTGNTDLTGLKLEDEFSIDGVVKNNALTWTAGNPADAFDLKQGETKTFTSTYTVQATDNSLSNTAKTDEDHTTTIPTPVEGKAAWTVEKTVSGANGADGKAVVGDVLTYIVTVTNTGNTDLSNLTLADEFKVDDVVKNNALTWIAGNPAEAFALAQGATKTFTATYTVQATDKNLSNAATVGSENAEVETVVEDTPDWEVEKEVTNEGTDGGKFRIGETIQYRITIINTGNVTLDGLAVKDDMFGSSPEINVYGVATYSKNGNTLTVSGIASGKRAVITYSHKVTEEDVLTGKFIKNIVTVSKDGKEKEDTVDTSIEEANPSLSAKKKLTNSGTGKGSKFKAGETAEFEIVVTNDGNVTQTNVTVTEKLAGAEIVKSDDGTYTIENGKAVIEKLAPGASVTVKAKYTITQADIDNSAELKNIAAVAGIDNTPEKKPEVEIPKEDKKPELTAEKTVTNEGTGTDGKFKVGDLVKFDITVTNSGNTTQENVVVSEQLAGAEIVEGEDYTINDDGEAVIAKMAPGAEVTVKAQYTVTQADIDSDAELKNFAVVKGSDGTPEKNPEVEIPKDRRPGLTATKEVTNDEDGTKSFKAGDQVTFDITVTNSGNTTQEKVTVSELLDGATIIAGDNYTIENGKAVITDMKPGDVVVVKAVYTVTQDDIDDGEVLKNTAKVDGDNGEEPDPTPETEIPESTKSDFEVGKELQTWPTHYKVGEHIDYLVRVWNTGDTTLWINLSDVMGAGDAAEVVDLHKAEINQRKVEMVVGHTDSVNLHILPGGAVTFQYSHTVTEEDIIAASKADYNWTNTATATSGSVSKDAAVTVTLETPNPHLTVTKTTTSTPKNGSTYALGEKIEYSVTVTNDGNLTIKNVKVEDTLLGKTGENAWNAGELKPGDSETFTGTYEVTETDILNGSVANSATASGEGPDDQTPEVTPDEVTVPTDPVRNSFEIAKTITSLSSDHKYGLDETIFYQITLKNTGNQTRTYRLDDTFSLKDAQIYFGDYGDIVNGEGYEKDSEGNITVKVKAGKTIVLTYNHKVTDEDIAAGDTLVNTIAVVDDADPKNEGSAEAIANLNTKENVLSAEKTLDNEGHGADGKFMVGETAEFTIAVTNKDNRVRTNIIVEEMEGATIVGGEGYTINDSGQAVIGSLEPGATVNVKAEYTVTQEDIDNQDTVYPHNIAVVKGNGTDPVEPQVDIPVVPKKPELTTTKELTNADEATGEDGKFKAGDVVKFTITVKNTGTVAQEYFTVKDMMEGAKITGVDADIPYIRRSNELTFYDKLAPEGTVTIYVEYTVTQEDIDKGRHLENYVTVDGTGNTPDSEHVPIPTEDPNPGLTATKTVTNKGSGENGAFKAGENVTFDITVTNSGNTTQHSVVVYEQLDGAEILEGEGYHLIHGNAFIDQMEPGATVTVKAQYTVTQEDIDSDAKLKNVAKVRGDNGEEPDPTPEIEIPEEEQKKSLSAVKTVTNAPEGGFKAGETAEFDITVTNTGNTTQTNVTVTEQLSGAVIVADESYTVNEAGQAVIAKLAPGASVAVKAVYTVTEADINDGVELKNVALVDGETGTNPDPAPEVVIPEEVPETPETPTPGGTTPGGTTPTPGGTTPGGTTTVTNPETEEIPDGEVPLTSIPGTEVPLAALPDELFSILDEDVPLSFMAPQTGDDRPVRAAALFGLLALGMMGVFGILASKKDEDEA